MASRQDYVLFFNVENAKDVLRFYREFSSGCPDELSTVGALLPAPDGTPAAAIAVCYGGSLKEGEKVLQHLRAFGSPVVDLIGPKSCEDSKRST